MRRKKHKHTRRAVLFYKINHGFRPPYRVLLDSNFMHAVMLAKIGDPAEILSKLLGAPVKVSTTKCVLHELHSMGEEFADTLRACRKIPKLTCAHDGEPVAAADCIASLIGVSNAEHFFVATQDRRLRSALSSNSGGGPSLFVSVNGLHLEEPSQAQHKQAKQAEQEHMAVKDHERSAPALQALAASSATRQERSIFRRKGAKGPNPLSIRKRKAKPSAGGSGGSSGLTQKCGEQGDAGKRKRKRVRRKGGTAADGADAGAAQQVE